MAPHSSTLAWRSLGWRSLEGCSPWGRWGLDMTEWLHFHALEKEMAPHSSVLAWRIPGMGEPGGLLTMGSDRVKHDWSDLAVAAVIFLNKNLGNFSKFVFIEYKNECMALLMMAPYRLQYRLQDFVFLIKKIKWAKPMLSLLQCSSGCHSFVSYNNLDEPGRYDAYWNKSDRSRQTPHIITYMWDLKKNTNEWT